MESLEDLARVRERGGIKKLWRGEMSPEVKELFEKLREEISKSEKKK